MFIKFSEQGLFTEIEEKHNLCPLGNGNLQTIKHTYEIWILYIGSRWKLWEAGWQNYLPTNNSCVELTHRKKGRIKKFLDQGCPEELSIMIELFRKSVLPNEVAKALTTNGYDHSKCG